MSPIKIFDKQIRAKDGQLKVNPWKHGAGYDAISNCTAICVSNTVCVLLANSATYTKTSLICWIYKSVPKNQRIICTCCNPSGMQLSFMNGWSKMFSSRILSFGFFFNKASIKSVAITDKCDGTWKENKNYRQDILFSKYYRPKHAHTDVHNLHSICNTKHSFS